MEAAPAPEASVEATPTASKAEIAAEALPAIASLDLEGAELASLRLRLEMLRVQEVARYDTSAFDFAPLAKRVLGVPAATALEMLHTTPEAQVRAA